MFTDVLGFDLKDAGLLSALPYLVMGSVVQFGGYMADRLLATGHLSTTRVIVKPNKCYLKY
jgi:ACS family sodium-dependent inorganic phosphate cotransporter